MIDTFGRDEIVVEIKERGYSVKGEWNFQDLKGGVDISRRGRNGGMKKYSDQYVLENSGNLTWIRTWYKAIWGTFSDDNLWLGFVDINFMFFF